MSMRFALSSSPCRNGEAAACGNRARVRREARRVAHGAAYLRQVFEVRAASDVHVQPEIHIPFAWASLMQSLICVYHAVLGKVSAGVRLAGARGRSPGSRAEFRFDAFRELAYHVGGADVHMDAVLLTSSSASRSKMSAV